MNKKTKRLLEENNCREKALSQESQAVMTDLVVYLRGQNISMYHQEEVRWDIQEMVLEAENRGETIAQVIGEDYQTFCDEIVAALPPRTWKGGFWTLWKPCCPPLPFWRPSGWASPC